LCQKDHNLFRETEAIELNKEGHDTIILSKPRINFKITGLESWPLFKAKEAGVTQDSVALPDEYNEANFG
jgi:hypothetical protein